MLATGEPAAAEGGQNETNLPWLLRLRWGALAGQLLTIVVVRYVMRLAAADRVAVRAAGDLAADQRRLATAPARAW